jgi:uncharacterized membrane protein
MGNLLTMLFSVWIGIGQALYFLKIARGQQATLADIFSGGPYFVSILLATILFFLIIAAVAGICLGPAGLLLLAGADSEVALMVFIPGLIVVLVVNVILSLMFSQYYYLILDRNVGPVESLTISKEITRGNKVTIFGIWMVAGLVGAVLIVCTCGLGLLAVAPYWALLYPIIYLALTGQRTADQFMPGRPMV